MINKEKKFFRLTPFKMQVLQSFPFIDADFDAMTNYELLCKVVEYLNITVDNVNLLNDDFVTLYNYVHDYFDNLDVQEEINNKLDDMAESGQLTDIIAQYLGLAGLLTFNTVSDMKNAENLVAGSTVKTYGFRNLNDNGGAFYKIKTIENTDIVNEMDIISLHDNTLVAILQYSSEITPAQFGAYGDNEHDEITYLQRCVEIAETNKLKIVSQGNKVYNISTTLNVDTAIINFNDATITSLNNINLITINSTNYYGELNHIKFDCTNANTGIYITNGRKKTFNNLIFENISNIGFYYNAGYEILLNDSHFKADGSSGTIGIYANSSDSKFNNIIMIDCQTAIVNKGLNFYNFIHAWIYEQSIVENSIFVDLQSNRSYYTQCYSDTYGITFNCNGGTFICDELEVFLNDSVWLSTMDNPYVIYFTDGHNPDTANTLTNSRINGVRSDQHIKYCNIVPSMVKNSNINKVWVDDFSGVVYEASGFGTNVLQVITNKITLNNGIVHVNLLLKVDSDTGKQINTSALNTNVQPLNHINTSIVYASSEWSSAGGLCYCYVGNNIQITLPGDSTGVKYVKCQLTYPNSIYGNI